MVLFLLLFRYLPQLTFQGAFGVVRGDLQFLTVLSVILLAVCYCRQTSVTLWSCCRVGF